MYRDLRILEGGFSRYVSLGTPSDGEKYQVNCRIMYTIGELNILFISASENHNLSARLRLHLS